MTLLLRAIRNLWTLGIFRDIRILQEVEGNGIKVIIKVELLPQVNEISVQGYDEFEGERYPQCNRACAKYG